MDPEEYDKLAEHDRCHWWYLGLQALALSFAGPKLHDLRECAADRAGDSLQILDAGCGTGGALCRLEQSGGRVGLDVSRRALDYAGERLSCPLCQGSVVALPFRDASFELVLCMDVIYHVGVESDLDALSEMRRVMKPGGVAIINVPAYELLRSTHDTAIHTKRRYTRKQIVSRIEEAGFRVTKATYWNTFLFPPMLLIRALRRWRNRETESDLRPAPPAINRLLYGLLLLERVLIRWVSLPFGLSVLCRAERDESVC